ncbi:MAG: cupin domain-containing protein [Candidatus Thorarchaeota archaeon]|jgi:mannose-6-phosphate isomerase-like protein (cupin superfamily)
MGNIGTHYLQDQQTDIEISYKVWGTEYIIGRRPYATKVMVLEPGLQVSTHLHRDKQETFVLISGQMIVEILDPAGTKSIIRLVESFSSITLKPMTPHTFYVPDGQGPAVFIESSTEDHPDDSYRLFPSGPKR